MFLVDLIFIFFPFFTSKNNVLATERKLMHFRIVKSLLTLPVVYHYSRNKITDYWSHYCRAVFQSQWKPELQQKYLFRTMACCGNSCGSDFSKQELKKRLTSIQYQVTQENDTERPFSGKYCNHHEKGIYMCVVCKQDLFSSESKYESKCGWPAFFDVVSSDNVKLKNDLTHDMKRIEASCSKCGAHLGHVFDDGPKPTGKRYCINSASLDFRKAEESPDTANS
ncbi:peptide methionine sulfoxide reductase MsrB isoform X2 [Parasteatoda tepidariorum]|uniref:peptide methionine sulfoxide reductase MsrB isoform X2 n=2 Tax=Parasteatoda tepidariorum TaxID=114398 RepID=UPI0039BC5AE3